MLTEHILICSLANGLAVGELLALRAEIIRGKRGIRYLRTIRAKSSEQS